MKWHIKYQHRRKVHLSKGPNIHTRTSCCIPLIFWTTKLAVFNPQAHKSPLLQTPLNLSHFPLDISIFHATWPVMFIAESSSSKSDSGHWQSFLLLGLLLCTVTDSNSLSRSRVNNVRSSDTDNNPSLRGLSDHSGVSSEGAHDNSSWGSILFGKRFRTR